MSRFKTAIHSSVSIFTSTHTKIDLQKCKSAESFVMTLFQISASTRASLFGAIPLQNQFTMKVYTFDQKKPQKNTLPDYYTNLTFQAFRGEAFVRYSEQN